MSRSLLPILRELCGALEGSVTLASLAARAGRSRFQFQRAFRRELGETPRQYVERLRLERAAGKLLATDDSVLDIALECGFSTHEVFTRAFRRHFGRTPVSYRTRALTGATKSIRKTHMALAAAIGPCVRLHHLSTQHPPRNANMPILSITRQDRAAQPVLLIRRRIPRTRLQPMLAECFGRLYGHGQQAGLPIAGWPVARYVATGAGLWTVEAAMPLAIAVPGEGEIEAGLLPGGAVVMGLHGGSYEQLPETNAAIEAWIEQHDLRVAGPHWECYVTDPAAHPDPADWRTEVCWPIFD